MRANEFWEENDTRKDQKFYVAFCLLQTALSDYATARDLHQHNKLNWASTAYYYSLVHAIRLITFTATGDFPTGHSELAELYKDKSATVRKSHSWLANFSEDYRNSLPEGGLSFNRVDVANQFASSKIGPSISEDEMEKWGEALDKARECRNDSNYEGLIIAHEHLHQIVTGSISKLAETLRKICEAILRKLILLFQKAIDSDARKYYWYAYLNWKKEQEGLYYFESAMKSKIQGNDIINSILKWVEPLRKAGTDVNQAEGVFAHIRLGVFDNKEFLMSGFEDNVEDLKRFCEKGILMEDFERRVSELEDLAGGVV